ncbi:MAG: polysaccharide deacetylase family protein [Bacteroidia bacterium]
MQQILVLAASESNRLTYILNELLVYRLGLSYKITTNEDYFLKTNSARIYYGNHIIEGCINIPSTTLLFQENIIKQNIETQQHKAWHTTFFNKIFDEIPDARKETHWLHFDILAASFYLLSRYEEYLPNKPDGHGRYNHSESLAFKSNFLQIPLIDVWLLQAKNVLQKMYPLLKFSQPQYKHINTVDIDMAFKYKYHSGISLLKKQLGHLLNKRSNAWVQLKKFKNNSIPDPYNTYDKLTKTNNETVFFWLLSNNRHSFDNNHPINNMAYKEIINKLPQHVKHGLHPSYHSSANSKELKAEKSHFNSLFGFEPNMVRWHFLKISLPKSYEMLIDNNIFNDWSFGYANTVGFRASTCMPFKFYNLKLNIETNLQITPVALMDVSLKNGLNLKPDEAIEIVMQLKNEAKKVNGLFVTIWHNSSFDETEGWQGWDKVYFTLFD